MPPSLTLPPLSRKKHQGQVTRSVEEEAREGMLLLQEQVSGPAGPRGGAAPENGDIPTPLGYETKPTPLPTLLVLIILLLSGGLAPRTSYSHHPPQTGGWYEF